MQLFRTKKHLTDDIPSLVKSACDGDARAQKSIFDMLSGKMFALCIRYMGDRDTAEDVLQDGFVTLFSKLDSYCGEGSFEGWARKIFVNTALMRLRRNDVLRDSADMESAEGLCESSPSPIQDIGYEELSRMIAGLPAGFRTVFNMYVIEGYSHKEIGEALGISEVTSRSQLQRARMLLQSKIKNNL